MRWCRGRLFPVVVVPVVLLASSFAQQPPGGPGGPARDQAKPAKSDPAADEALRKALENLDPKRTDFLKTTIWQQLDVQGLTFQADGSYILGPRQQMKLDLKIKVGGATGRLQEFSDGNTLWEVTEIGTQPRTVKKVDLHKVLQVLDPPNLQQTREEFLQSESFAGVLPLLATLRKQIAFTEKQNVYWQGKDVILLTGSWANVNTDPKQWPESLPRRCRLFLDRDSYWPYRLEWWGPTAGRDRDKDALLMQIEFRDPTHERVEPSTFVPPAEVLKGPIVDQTEMYEAGAKKRARMAGPRVP